ncbi:MAG: acyl--CoA ligase [Nitratireductor sp.]|nr:acyl--CoA ligase [Nitratireductor sp.]
MNGASGFPRNFAAMLREGAARWPDRHYAVFPERTLTFGALHEEAARFAANLLGDGIGPGDHVAIVMPNSADFLVAHMGVQLVGGCSVLFSTRFRETELAHLLEHCDAGAIIVSDLIDAHIDLAALIGHALATADTGGNHVAGGGEVRPRLLYLFGRKEAAGFRTIRPGELEQGADGKTNLPGYESGPASNLMIYTSGTTSMPKGCMLSAETLMRSWNIYAKAVGLEGGQKIWVPLPFFHCGGIGLATLCMAYGLTLVSRSHFDADSFARMIEEHRVDHLYPVFHTISMPLLASAYYDRDRWAGFLKSMVSVGPLGGQEQLRDSLPDDARIMNVFGMTESSGVLTVVPPDAPEKKRLATCGRPMPGVEVRIVDPETLDDVAAGEKGEILFRGGGAFMGYYKDDSATEATVLSEGWIRTGDLGFFDTEGWLHFSGRLKDMLKVGGENVAAAEIEAFLSTYPAVALVQVVGRDDSRLGEVPVAFIECRGGHDVSEEDIVAFCRGRIASFKVPRQVVFMKEWPMSATKIQKHALRKMLDTG